VHLGSFQYACSCENLAATRFPEAQAEVPARILTGFVFTKPASEEILKD
jgi:hypothetical protein